MKLLQVLVDASNALKRDYRYVRLKVSKDTYTRMMPFDPAST